MEELTNKAILISGIEDTADKVSLLEQIGDQQYPTKYSFFKQTQAGEPSKAFTQYQELNLSTGKTCTIAVKETKKANQFGKEVTYRNIAYFVTGDTQTPVSSEKPATGQNRPSGGYQKQPPKDFKATMDYKETQIAKMQDNKEESMRLFSSGRDAVLMVTTYKDLNLGLDEESIKKDVVKWRNWFYQNIYNMSEDEYKSLNSPF